MNIVQHRFGNNLSSARYQNRLKARLFERLRADRPIDLFIKVRTKNPAVDLKLGYHRRIARSGLLAFLGMVLAYALYPEYHPTVSMLPRPAAIIEIQNIPETHQAALPPAPPRPKVPIAVEGELVPEDVTIESTELDFDSVPIDLRLSVGPIAVGQISDEPLDYMEIDYKPHPIRIVTPEYPEVARRQRKEGRVMVRVLVDKSGNVEKVEVMNGPEIFRNAALSAAQQFRFRPGKHAGERRKVWMLMPIDFSLK